MSKMIELTFAAVNRIPSRFHVNSVHSGSLFDLCGLIAHRSQGTGHAAWTGCHASESTGMRCERGDVPTVGAGIVGASADLHQSAARSRSRLPEHMARSSSSESPLRCRL